MRLFFFVWIYAAGIGAGMTQAPIESFPLSSVRLLNGPFKQAQETDLRYMLSLDANRLLAPYLKEAGLEPKAKSYGNWENTGLDGHIGGHYLSALANMYAATGNKQVAQRLNYMIGWLDKCQQKNGDGYVGGIPGGKAMWQEVAAGRLNASSFSLNNKWVPLYNIHKLFAGLVDAFSIAGNQNAKAVLVKLSDWFLSMASNLSDEQIQTILRSEHGGMNEALADVAVITGDKKYLELAKRLSHRSVLNPLLQQKDALNGLHANTQIPKVIGYMRIATVSGDTAWVSAADFFWNTVTRNRTISIGGNSVREHFHPAADFSSMIETKEGPETCNTYNMLKLSKQLFLYRPSVTYMDYYERAMYNHILSSQHPDGGFVYFTPIRPRHYRVYSQPQESFWCCVGTGLENHGKYGELIYVHNSTDLFVNLFIPSILQWKEKGLVLEQQTRFPYEEGTTFKLMLKTPRRFALHFRYPSWVPEGKLKASVNGKEVAITRSANSYASINRNWKTGDVISLSLPMETRAEALPDGSQWVSFVRGPIVLAAATDTTGLTGLKADDSRMGHIANGPSYPIEEAPMIVSPDKNFASALQPEKNKAFTYTAPALIYPAIYKNLQLVPFYTVHDSRYMLYWRYATPAQLESITEELRRSEEGKRALEAITVDYVTPGEQQPEADHFVESEASTTGVYRERHFREAKGWFSYKMRDKEKKAAVLQVTYWGRDRSRRFKILVNDEAIADVQLNDTGKDSFYSVDYAIPEAVLQKAAGQFTVKFLAGSGSVAGGIYEVRLLKKKQDEKQKNELK